MSDGERKRSSSMCSNNTLQNLYYNKRGSENFVVGSGDLKSRWQTVRWTRPLRAMLQSKGMMKYLGTNTIQEEQKVSFTLVLSADASVAGLLHCVLCLQLQEKVNRLNKAHTGTKQRLKCGKECPGSNRLQEHNVGN